MKSWSSWFPDLLPWLPGCPIPTVEHVLRRTCQDFFGRTRAWKVYQDPFKVFANQQGFDIEIDDSNQEPVRIESAWLNGQRLNVFGASDMDASFTDDWQSHTGSTSTLVQITPGSVLLYPVPVADSTTGLKLRLSVRPSDTASGIPDEMFVKFRQAITDGVLGHLMLQPAVEFSNPVLGQDHRDSYKAARDAATLAALRSFGSGRIASRAKFA